MNINTFNHSTIDGKYTEMSEVHSGFSVSVQIKYAILFLGLPKSVYKIPQMGNSYVNIVYVS
jgi:hypothetical protein